MKLNQLYFAPAIILTLLGVNQNLWAETSHQFEIVGSYTDMNSDGSIETSGYMGGIQAYLNPVSAKNYPYAESQFLAREPFVAAGFGHVNLELFSEVIEGNFYMLGGGYRSKKNPVFVEMVYGKTDLDGEINNNKLDYSMISKQFNIGVYFNRLSAAKISYAKTNFEINSTTNSEKEDVDQYQLAVKNLLEVSENSFFNVELVAIYEKGSDGDKNQAFGFLTDYYPNQSLGFGFGVKLMKGDNESSEGKDVVLRAKKFVTPNFSLGLTFDKFIADESGNDSQTIQVDGEFRF